jgi:hypothetical protein
VAHYGPRKGACRLDVKTPEGKKQLFVPRIKWDKNNGFELKEIGLEVIDLNDLPQDKNNPPVCGEHETNIRVS